MSAQRPHTARANSLSRAIVSAANVHMAAQSTSRAMQRAIDATSVSRRHEAAQWLQATAQRWHASMQGV
jgi:hypothetical protein